MSHNREKQQIVSINPELLLCENGNFKIKSDLAEKYERHSILSVLRPTEIEQERINIFSRNAKKLLNV